MRIAVEQHDELGEQLIRRHLAPVAAHPGAAEILDTLRTYLSRGRSIGSTADALSVHPNTIRYRLRRIESLTTRSLRNPQHLAELITALNALRVRN